jgi:hypothetical protein
MGDEQEHNLWAVVVTAGGKFIGNIGAKTDNEVLKVIKDGGFIKLYEACEVMVNLIPVPVEGGVQMRREVGATPFMMTLHGAPLHVKPVAVQFLDDMHELDAAGYKKLAGDAKKMADAVRLAMAGIKVADRPLAGGGNRGGG